MKHIAASLFLLLTITSAPAFAVPAANFFPAAKGKLGGKTAAAGAGAGAKKPAAAAAGKGASGATADAPAAGGNKAGASKNGVSDAQISNAVSAWMNDTGKVSNFLDKATSFSGDEFTRQATIALNAEKDELNHKAVLDEALGDQSAIQSANDTLVTQGSFQAVVDALQSMVDQGPDTAQAQVDAINKNRCVSVLPNIDAYFSVAGSSTVSAVRATGCLEVTGSAAAATATDASKPSAAADAGGASSASTTSSASGSAKASKKPAATPSATAGAKAAAGASDQGQKGAGNDGAAAASTESPTTTTTASDSSATAAKKGSGASTAGSRSAASSPKPTGKSQSKAPPKGAKSTSAA